jgi:Fic family protein
LSITSPGTERPAGYAALFAELGIHTYVPQRQTFLSASTYGARIPLPEITAQGHERLVVAGRTAVDPSPVGQLLFALRYDGVDMEALRLVFDKLDHHEIEAGIRAQPVSVYARRLWYLYESMTERSLDIPPVAKRSYEPLLNPERYITCEQGRSQRHGILVNCLGTAKLCPTIRRTAILDAEISQRPLDQVDRIAGEMDGRRAARICGYLLGRESQGSFQIEGITPEVSDDELMSSLIKHVTQDPRPAISSELLHSYQNQLVAGVDQERSGAYRNRQVWIGDRRGYVPHPEYIAPQPRDVAGLMAEFCSSATQLTAAARFGQVDQVAAGAAISATFIYIHPFMDGNGRISRLLLQQPLTASPGPDGKRLFLPISAAIHRHQRDYYGALEVCSRQIMRNIDYEVRDGGVAVTRGTADNYRYLDLTKYTEFIYASANRAVQEDIPEERRMLAAFDAVQPALERAGITDERAHLCFKLLKQNNWSLSKLKRTLFPEISDQVADELAALASTHTPIHASGMPRG